MTKRLLYKMLKNKNFDLKTEKDYVHEIRRYISNIRHRDTVPIYFDGEIESLEVEDVITLAKSYLYNKLLEWDLEYIMSILDLSYIGGDEKLEKVFYTFSDPYLGTCIDKENIRKAIDYLQGKTDELEVNYLNHRLKEKKKSLRPNYKTIVDNINEKR